MAQNLHRENRKWLPGVPWLFLSFVAILFSIVLVFTLIPWSMAAQSTMEVYQQSGHKAFGKETQLDIFNDPGLGGKKLIHPFTNGTYTFAVYNNSNTLLLPYSLLIEAKNPDNIPLVVSLQKNGNYVFGGAGISNMLPLTSFEFDEYTLSGNKTDLYTIRWAWDTETDLIDTEIGLDGTQIYSLKITATGTTPETSADIKTGDETIVWPWILIMAVCVVLILILLFSKRKEREDDPDETDPEDR